MSMARPSRRRSERVLSPITEVVEVEDPFGLDNGPAEATERILARNPGRQQQSAPAERRRCHGGCRAYGR